MRFFDRAWLLAAILFLGAVSMCAQVDTGTIMGRVTDPSGAVVQGAQITVTQVATNIDSVTQTNSEGIYRVQSLRPGAYRVTIVVSGFKKVVRENLELRLSDTMPVDVALEVGSQSEVIEVTTAAPLLETETSATGQVITGDFFYSMPNYQRNVKTIVWMTPGFTFQGNGSSGAYSGNMNNYHINGLSSSTIGFFEDGVMATTGNGMTSNTIMNTVEQVKVVTTALPAEYGHSAGGLITVAKKSGANQVHGLVSDFGRIRPLQHRKFFDQRRNSDIYAGHERGDTLLFQQPDANLSGPVYIPKIYDGRNKTFFFVAWQKLIEKQAKQAVYTVPTEAMKGGDFSFGGIGQPIYDPASRRQVSGSWTADPFVGNIIPTTRFDPVAVKVLSFNPYTPASRAGNSTTTGPTDNLYASPLKKVFWPNYSYRLDQQFKPSLKGFASYTYNKIWEISNGTTVQYRPFDSAAVASPTFQQTYSLGAVWVPSSTMVADTRVGYFRSNAQTVSPSYRQNVAGQLGIPNVAPDTFPGGLYTISQGQPSVNLNENVSFKEDVTKVKGTHTIKFGYELMRYRQNSYSPGNLTGTFSFTSTAGVRTNGQNQTNQGNSFAAFLLGYVSSFSASRNLFASHPRVWQNSFYVQDDWKIRPSLMLNLGLRYSVETPPAQKYGLISIWDPNAADTSQYTGWTCPAPCKGAWTHPQDAKPYNTDKNNFQPFVGLAWHPIQRLVVRSGFRLSTVDMKFSNLSTSEMMSDSTSISQATGDPRPLYQISKFPGFTYPARRAADNSVPYVGTPSGHSATIVDPNLQAPYTMSWNFGIQYELSRNYMVETMYSGSATVGSTGSMEMNTLPWGYLANDPAARDAWIPTAQYSRPWPNWGNISYVGNFGHATHHEGTVKVEKRSSHGLTFLAFYTLAKSLDGNVSNRYLDIGLNKGRSDFDQRHRFSASTTYELPIGEGRWLLNHKGVTNVLFGGWELVASYDIASGAPLGMGISNAGTVSYPGWMPSYGNVILKRRPKLRDKWTDLGLDRFNTANQNSMIDCGPATSSGNDCFSYIPSYERGNNGRNLWDAQRQIGFSVSASKEIAIRERMKLQLRYDFQNPLHWFNWPAPSTTLSLTNPQLYGKVTPGNEGTTAHMGGVPLMNITVALKW